MHKKYFFIPIIIGFILINLSNCQSPQKKNKPIQEKDFINLLTDIHLADGITKIAHSTDENPKIYADSVIYKKIFIKHGYTEQEIKETLKYYATQEPDQLQKIYKEILERLNQFKAKQEQKKEQKASAKP